MGHLLTIFDNGFSPVEAEGLAIWLDALPATNLTLSGDLVTQWDNHGNVTGVGHAVQAVATHRPKYVASAINGKPGVQGLHDGSNASQLEIADVTGLNYAQFTSFVVANRVSDLNATESIHGKYTISGNQREQRLFISGSDDRPALQYSQDGTSGGSSVTELATTTTIGTPFIMMVHYDGSSLTLTRNNAMTNTVAYASGFYNGVSPYYLFSISGSQVEPYAGHIGEFLFYNKAMMADEINAVYAYLSSKWGVV